MKLKKTKPLEPESAGQGADQDAIPKKELSAQAGGDLVHLMTKPLKRSGTRMRDSGAEASTFPPQAGRVWETASTRQCPKSARCPVARSERILHQLGFPAWTYEEKKALSGQEGHAAEILQTA